MSKLSFRARAVDASKQMPVFLAEELPDLSEYASINRSVPQMPTGMEKDEEMELHLQQAISAQQRISTGHTAIAENAIIPIPKVTSDVKYYERLYPADYRLPKQLIKVQAALNLEPEIPDYDLDSEDERWLSTQTQKLDFAPLQFERIMDTLEKQSEFKVITPAEAKLLLQEDDDMLLAVYDYWLSKRFMAASQGKNLIPRVKTEKRDGTGAKHNPYVAFRRRAEKMQTRKNRRNDEESYEKILKLRHDLQKAVTLAEMVKRREKSKREMINLTLDIVEKRFVLEDFRDELFSQICNDAKPSFRFSKQEMGPPSANNKKSPIIQIQIQNQQQQQKRRKTPSCMAKEDKGLVSREWLLQNEEEWNRPPASFLLSPKATTATSEVAESCQSDKEPAEPAGRFTFKRRRGCRYYAPTSSIDVAQPPLWPWEQPRSRYSCFPTYLHSRYIAGVGGATTAEANAKGVSGLRFIGLARRRIGRGGRMLFDRRPLSPPNDDEQEQAFDDFPSTSSETVVHRHVSSVVRKDSLYFRPYSPPPLSELEDEEQELAFSMVSPIPVSSSTSSSSSSAASGFCQSVPFATVVGPHGMLRLPMTIGSIAQSMDERRKSPMFLSSTTTAGSHQQQNSAGDILNSSVQRQFSFESTTTTTRLGDTTAKTVTEPRPTRGRKKKITTVQQQPAADMSVFAQPATPTDAAYLSTRNENGDSNNGESKSTPASTTPGQWRKQDFGATTALLMRPPVKLPPVTATNSTIGEPTAKRQHRDPRGSGNRPTQVQGIAASPTVTTSGNYSMLGAFKGGQDLVGMVNNGKVGIGVVAADSGPKPSGSPHPPNSAHTYALPPASYNPTTASSRQNAMPPLKRTFSSSGLAANETQSDGGQQSIGDQPQTTPNGPVLERPVRRAYGPRAQQQQTTVTVTSPVSNAKLFGATAPSMVRPPPTNLPLDHGSYHANSFMPPVAVVSAPSLSVANSPIASTAPSVVNMANGGVTQEAQILFPEATMTAQYNGQRNHRDQQSNAGPDTPPSSSSGVVELSHPLPTPSPSPNARFNLADAGVTTMASKFDEINAKTTSATVASVFGRLTPTRIVGKNRKSADE